MSSHRTAVVVTMIATMGALAGCTGDSSSPGTSAASPRASSSGPATSHRTTLPSTPAHSPSSTDATADSPTSSEGGSPTAPPSTGGAHSPTGETAPPPSHRSAPPKATGPSFTLKVSGSAKLKVTKITLEGAITSTEHAPVKLKVKTNPTVKIGYTITAVALSGKITSCVAVLPHQTKHITPTHGACTVTYTPGG